MRIAIAGAGIAGSYLAKLLGLKGIDSDVFDGMNHDTRCGFRSCGWGVPFGIGTYLAGAGLNLEKYLLEPMPSMHFDGLVAQTPLCTIDKPRLLRDLIHDTSLEQRNLGTDEAEDYDIVVDATGFARTFLPPCRSDLILPTRQHRVLAESNGNECLPAGVYGNQVPGLGYLWVFPIGKNLYHIGAGGIGLDRLDHIMDRFYMDMAGRFSFTTLCTCEGTIRVASPYYATPCSARKIRAGGKSQLIIGAGESIGTVSPFTGEGIIHSLECARILSDSWPDPDRYTREVQARFAWMRRERETLDYLLSRKGKAGPRMRDRWRFYLNARRSGIELPMLEAFRRIGTLSQWVEVGPS